MLSFPASPSNGDEYTDPNGEVWQFDGVRWEVASTSGIKQFYGVKVSLASEEFLTSTLNLVEFDTVDFDTGNFFDTTNANNSGVYSITLDEIARGVYTFGVYGTTPVAQPNTNILAGTFISNNSGIIDDTATFGGYTIGQVVKALQDVGLLA